MRSPHTTMRNSPHSPQLEKACARQDSAQQKKKKFKINSSNNDLVVGFPNGSVGKESACNTGDTSGTGLTLQSGRSPGGGHGNPLQYSCLENPLDRGVWKATVHRVAKSWARLSDGTTTVLITVGTQ